MFGKSGADCRYRAPCTDGLLRRANRCRPQVGSASLRRALTAVLPSDVEQLPELRGYLKLASHSSRRKVGFEKSP